MSTGESARLPGNVAPGDPAPDDVTVVLQAETVHAGLRRVPVERVRITKRIVTEIRTIDVELRREELHVERLPIPEAAASADDAPRSSAAGTEPILVLVLHEEVPEVLRHVVPVEQVRVFRDTIDGTETVSADVRREQAELLTDPPQR